jgi:hypothetical protein
MLVVLALMAALLAILLPVFVTMRQHAKSAMCISNLSQLGRAVKSYCSDYDDHMPFISTLFVGYSSPLKEGDVKDPDSPIEVLRPYTKDKGIFNCPSAVNGLPNSPNKKSWQLTYVFAGYDYELSSFGYDVPDVDLDRFDGELQEGQLRTGSYGNVWWIRDSHFLPQNSMGGDLLVAHQGFSNRLFSDGRVRAVPVDKSFVLSSF